MCLLQHHKWVHGFCEYFIFEKKITPDDDLTHFFENNTTNLTVQSANPLVNNLYVHFAYSFGYFGAISLFFDVIGQMAMFTPLISISPETNMIGAKGFITAFHNASNLGTTFTIDNDKISVDSVPLTSNGSYSVYGVWYTR